MDLVFALVIGITSAFVYSLIQGLYLYFRWTRTRRFFLSEIRGVMMYLDYHVTNILDINPIYDTEFEIDHLMTHEEFISEIEDMDISNQQYKQLNYTLKYTSDKIEKARKEALTIPTFTSKDFHAVDKFIIKISTFLSSYYWLCEEVDNSDTHDILKCKLVDVLNIAEENPFPNNFLDRIRNWQKRKSFSIKQTHRKHTWNTKNHKKNLLLF